MLELVTVEIGKFVRNINKKEKKRIIQKSGSSKWFVKNMCIRFVTIR